MDRTAWIVVALCVAGLVVWEVYLAKQMAPRPAPVTATQGQTSPTATPAALTTSPSPLATPEPAAQAAESTPSFAEKIETLRNSDVELRFTNRGGGIAEGIATVGLVAYLAAVRRCSSFDRGNQLARVLPDIARLTETQVNQLVSAFNENSELRGSFGFNGTR